MHCALSTAVGGKARVIISKGLWKRIEMLFYKVLCAIQELNIIIIINEI